MASFSVVVLVAALWSPMGPTFSIYPQNDLAACWKVRDTFIAAVEESNAAAPPAFTEYATAYCSIMLGGEKNRA